MKKREQFHTARRIADIRRLQLERARLDTLRVVQAFEHSRAHEDAMSAQFDAHLDGWRRALDAPAGLSPSIALNWAGAVVPVRAAHVEAQQAMQRAAGEVGRQRAELMRHEQQAELAGDLARCARRRLERERDEQQASRVEDLYLSQGER